MSPCWPVAALFSWQGKMRSVLSVVICTSSTSPSCLSATWWRDRVPNYFSASSESIIRAGKRNYLSLQPALPSHQHPPAPITAPAVPAVERPVQTAEGSRPARRTGRELGLELVPQKASEAVPCAVPGSVVLTPLQASAHVFAHPSPAASELRPHCRYVALKSHFIRTFLLVKMLLKPNYKMRLWVYTWP